MLNSLKGLQLDWCFFDPKNCIQESRPSATATHSTVRHLEGVISVSWLCRVGLEKCPVNLLILTVLHWMQKNNIWHGILDVADFNCEFKRILNGCFREAEKELVFASHVCRTRLHEKVLFFLRVFFCAELVVAMVILFRLAKYALDKQYVWSQNNNYYLNITPLFEKVSCNHQRPSRDVFKYLFHIITLPDRAAEKVVVVRRSFPYSFQGKHLSDCRVRPWKQWSIISWCDSSERLDSGRVEGE